MQITFYGHSCFCVEVQQKKILFDPYISQNPQAKNISLDSIEADYICISHAHNDHMADAPYIASRTNALLIGVWEVMLWFEQMGYTKTHKMNFGGAIEFEGFKIKIVNAVHTSRFSDGTNGGNPCGFLITSKEGNFYFAGDTALHYDMKLLGKHHKVDIAFLPIGNTFTMDVDDAIIASKYIKCDTIIGMHYDTEPSIEIDHLHAKAKFSDQDKKLILMKIGQTIEF